MKEFTAKDLNNKRFEIRKAVQDGGAVIRFLHNNRELDFEAVMVEKSEFEFHKHRSENFD